jgi:molybdopterin/thiamine biosynthesis adenylyltransferase
MSETAPKRISTAQDSEDSLSRAKKPRTNIENAAMTAAGEIDEDLHSRQLAVYGRESFRRLAGASVLVCGLKGLGAEIGKAFTPSFTRSKDEGTARSHASAKHTERLAKEHPRLIVSIRDDDAPNQLQLFSSKLTPFILPNTRPLPSHHHHPCSRHSQTTAKNVILAGVKSVTLQDCSACELSDLGAQFYLTEGDVGKNRAEACAARLSELNPAVEVLVVTEPVTVELCAKHRVVVCTETDYDTAVEINAACRDAGAAFIRGDVRGIFGSLFCDFGAEFDVLDVDGEEPHSCIIASVSNETTPMVTCVDDDRVELQDGQRVIFTETRGMTELNACVGGYVIKDVKAHSFKLQGVDTTDFSPYTGGGIATQIKEQKKLAFKTLAHATAEPGEFLLSDFAKFDRGAGLSQSPRPAFLIARARTRTDVFPLTVCPCVAIHKTDVSSFTLRAGVAPRFHRARAIRQVQGRVVPYSGLPGRRRRHRRDCERNQRQRPGGPKARRRRPERRRHDARQNRERVRVAHGRHVRRRDRPGSDQSHHREVPPPAPVLLLRLHGVASQTRGPDGRGVRAGREPVRRANRVLWQNAAARD